MENTATEDTGK